MTTASTADERLPTRMPDNELPRASSHPSDGLEKEPKPATTFAFGLDTRHDNNDNKRSVPNVRLPAWDGKRRTEPGAYKKWKRFGKATQLAYNIQDHHYAPLLFLATKDDARDVFFGSGR